jgi:hypothetical protein
MRKGETCSLQRREEERVKEGRAEEGLRGYLGYWGRASAGGDD